jgi:hypothetical protein
VCCKLWYVSLFHFYVVHMLFCIWSLFLFHISITVLIPVLQKKMFHLNVFLIGQ